MRSLSRKQVGVPALVGASPTASATPRWSRWPRRRALNPEAGVRLPVAVRTGERTKASASERRRAQPARCQVVQRQDVRLLPGRRGFDPLPGSATPGGRGSRRAAADRDTGVRVPPGRPCRSDATERGSFSSNTPRDGRSRCKPEGQQPASFLVPPGSRIAVHVVVVQRLRMSGRHPEDAGSTPADHTTHTTPTTMREGRW